MKTPEDLRSIKGVLRDMHVRGTISIGDYYKGLVAVASDWAAIGNQQEAVQGVSEIPLNYLVDVLPLHMAQDEEFAVRALALAQAIRGVVSELPSNDEAAIDLLLLSGPLVSV